MNEKFRTLLFYLDSAEEALTTNELYDIMTEEDREQYHGPGEISKHLNKLREQKKWVSNGIEQNHKNSNRTFLTWQITTEGKLALEAHDDDTQNSNATLSGIDTPASAQQPIPENTRISDTEQPTDKINKMEQPTETIEIDDPLAFYDSVHDSVRAMLEMLLFSVRSWPRQSVHDSVRAMLEMLLNHQTATTIQRKQGKIEVLEYFQKFAQPLNADFATVLGDIIQDLQKLEETK